MAKIFVFVLLVAAAVALPPKAPNSRGARSADEGHAHHSSGHPSEGIKESGFSSSKESELSATHDEHKEDSHSRGVRSADEGHAHHSSGHQAEAVKESGFTSSKESELSATHDEHKEDSHPRSARSADEGHDHHSSGHHSEGFKKSSGSPSSDHHGHIGLSSHQAGHAGSPSSHELESSHHHH